MNSKDTNGTDHPSVKEVIGIAKEILSENRILNIDNLYSQSKRRLKIPREGLLKIIQHLLNKKILIEGSKYMRETILSNPTRKKIFEFIQTQNGINFSSIRKEIFGDKGAGQIIWHLDMLLKFTLIKKIKIGGYTIFMPVEINDNSGILNFFLKDAINEKILRLLGSNKNVKRSDIYKMIKENREQVYYRIKILIDNGLITFNEDSDKEIRVISEYASLISKIQ